MGGHYCIIVSNIAKLFCWASGVHSTAMQLFRLRAVSCLTCRQVPCSMQDHFHCCNSGALPNEATSHGGVTGVGVKSGNSQYRDRDHRRVLSVSNRLA